MSMEKLNDYVAALKSEKYKTYLEEFETYYTGEVLLNTSKRLPYIEKNSQEVIILPEYEDVANVLRELNTQRNKEFLVYRFLRNKLLYDTEDKMIKDKYNAQLDKLKKVNEEIQLFETYKRIMYQDIKEQRDSIKHHIANLLTKKTKHAYDLNKTIKEKQQELHNSDTVPVSYYMKREPYWMKIQTEEKPKKNRKFKKTKKGASGGANGIPLRKTKQFLKKLFVNPHNK